MEETARTGRTVALHFNFCSGTTRVPPVPHRLNRQGGKGRGGHAWLGLRAARSFQGSRQGASTTMHLNRKEARHAATGPGTGAPCLTPTDAASHVAEVSQALSAQ